MWGNAAVTKMANPSCWPNNCVASDVINGTTATCSSVKEGLGKIRKKRVYCIQIKCENWRNMIDYILIWINKYFQWKYFHSWKSHIQSLKMEKSEPFSGQFHLMNVESSLLTISSITIINMISSSTQTGKVLETY